VPRTEPKLVRGGSSLPSSRLLLEAPTLKRLACVATARTGKPTIHFFERMTGARITQFAAPFLESRFIVYGGDRRDLIWQDFIVPCHGERVGWRELLQAVPPQLVEKIGDC
jgi:hypothetical protein